MMRKGILITLPKSDEVTEYLSVFSKPIIDVCSKKSIEIKSIIVGFSRLLFA